MKANFRRTKIGKIGIAEEAGNITNLYFETDDTPEDVEIGETETIKKAFRQLDAYLSGDLREFSLPLAPQGTDFMQHVWKILCEVPYGKTADRSPPANRRQATRYACRNSFNRCNASMRRHLSLAATRGLIPRRGSFVRGLDRGD